MQPKYTSNFTLALALAFGLPASAQLQPARTIILIGPPGSGKTVQADALRKRYRIPTVSIAQLLHREITRKSPIGQTLAASLDSGELVADGPANDLIRNRLLNPDAGNGFILDGYPATEDQARALDQWLNEHNFPKPTVIVLELSEQVSRARLVRRRRSDDEPLNIERRLRDYREVGRLVEQWYGPERIIRVNAAGTPPEVALRIANGVDAIHLKQGLKTRQPADGGLKQREPEGSAAEQKQ